jgi:hypothetical protein
LDQAQQQSFAQRQSEIARASSNPTSKQLQTRTVNRSKQKLRIRVGVIGRGEKADSPNVRIASRFETPSDLIGTGYCSFSRSIGSNEHGLGEISVSIVFQIRSDTVATHLLRIHDAAAPIGQYTHMNKLHMPAWMVAIQGFAHPDNSVAVTAAQGNERDYAGSHPKPSQLPTAASASRRTACA